MIRAALASGLDRVLLSTGDDEIAAAGTDYGIAAPVRRPAGLATDCAATGRGVLHALDGIEVNVRHACASVGLRHPTGPCTRAREMDECIDPLNKTSAN